VLCAPSSPTLTQAMPLEEIEALKQKIDRLQAHIVELEAALAHGNQ